MRLNDLALSEFVQFLERDSFISEGGIDSKVLLFDTIWSVWSKCRIWLYNMAVMCSYIFCNVKKKKSRAFHKCAIAW